LVGDHVRTETRQAASSWPQSGGPHPRRIRIAGHDALIHRDGDRLIIEPLRKRGLLALLKTMTPLDESFPDID